MITYHVTSRPSPLRSQNVNTLSHQASQRDENLNLNLNLKSKSKYDLRLPPPLELQRFH